MLGKVFDQDSFNMPKVQKGLEQTRKPGVTLGQLPGEQGALARTTCSAQWVEGLRCSDS